MRKKHRKVPRPRPGACLALVLLALTPGALRADETTRPDHVSESKAPDITFGDINPRSASHGESLALADLYADRGVILNFIASWCGPCWSEAASFQKLFAEGLPIVCIAADEHGGTSDVLRKAEQVGLSMPILHVPAEQISATEELYDHPMLPATYVIDAQGVVRETFLGAISSEALLEALRIALPDAVP
jgi:thiol-disulfide isomerase/thioredoxin